MILILPFEVPIMKYNIEGIHDACMPFCIGIPANIAYMIDCGISIKPKVEPAIASLAIHFGSYFGNHFMIGTFSAKYVPVALGNCFQPLLIAFPDLLRLVSFLSDVLILLNLPMLT